MLILHVQRRQGGQEGSHTSGDPAAFPGTRTDRVRPSKLKTFAWSRTVVGGYKLGPFSQDV